MRLWVPVAAAAAAAGAVYFLYGYTADAVNGQSPVALVNTVGLVGVVLGLLAAALILRRARPPA